jgi:hypothetical protein
VLVVEQIRRIFVDIYPTAAHDLFRISLDHIVVSAFLLPAEQVVLPLEPLLVKPVFSQSQLFFGAVQHAPIFDPRPLADAALQLERAAQELVAPVPGRAVEHDFDRDVAAIDVLET